MAHPQAVEDSHMTLAYFDSFSGLIPVRIVSVVNWDDSKSNARFLVTATRGTYKRGDEHTYPLARLCPRYAVYRSQGCLRIRPYTWTLCPADRKMLRFVLSSYIDRGRGMLSKQQLTKYHELLAKL